jgi:hypothetical protein
MTHLVDDSIAEVMFEVGGKNMWIKPQPTCCSASTIHAGGTAGEIKFHGNWCQRDVQVKRRTMNII